jgi:hypothetical protein
MTQPSLESFFGVGGGKSVSWKDKPIGTSVSGTITAVHPPRQQTDPVDQKPLFKRNGEPKMSVRIDLQTDFRNWELTKRPDDPNETDDGMRSLYVQGWMQGSIGEALSKAGRQGPPEVGGKLTVTLNEREPNVNPALNPINKFTAEYVSPGSQATGAFFGQTSGSAPVGATAVNGGGVATAAPVKPSAISDAAWAAMDDATKAAVAKTMGDDQPPF